MKIRKRHARTIRRAIETASRCGWSAPPTMQWGRNGTEYADSLYGRAWERTMRRRGLYPPPPPRSRGRARAPQAPQDVPS